MKGLATEWEEVPEETVEPETPPTTEASKCKKGPSQADRLIAVAKEWEFFHTSDDRGFANVPTKGHHETIAVRSRKFRGLLITKYHLAGGKGVSSSAIEEAIAFFEGECLCGLQIPVHTRLVAYDGAIYLDLCNEDWEAVKDHRGGLGSHT